MTHFSPAAVFPWTPYPVRRRAPRKPRHRTGDPRLDAAASLPARQDYADGEARWRAGRLAAAVALYRAALAADPGFAMARAALAR